MDLVETKMHWFKRLGESVAARNFDRQASALNIRAAILSGSSEYENSIPSVSRKNIKQTGAWPTQMFCDKAVNPENLPSTEGYE